MEENKQKCVFSYYKDGEFMGYRADSFGSLDKKYPKIYTYTESQLEIIRRNVQSELSRSGSRFMEKLFRISSTVPMNTEGQLLDKNAILDQVSKGEQEKREWKNFEVKVIPFCTYEEFSELCTPGEEYKKQQYLDNLPEPLKIMRFQLSDYEN